ncbi:MAG: lipoprotein-releasing ABC transporter permease subunit [Planctomycetota bacterium]
MYRWYLALRYLLTRPINLLGVIGVMLGVWALIVVVAIFSGFLDVVRHHVRSAASDISVLAIPESATWTRVREVLMRETNVRAAAPRLVHSGLIHRPGERPAPLPLPGRSALQGGDGPFVSILGIDPEQERGVTGFAAWIVDPAIPAAMKADLPSAPLADRDGFPAILIGLDRMRRSGLQKGDHVLFTSGDVRTDQATGRRTLLSIHGEFVIAGAFRTLHAGFDGNNVLVHIDRLRSLVRPAEPDSVLEAAVAVSDETLIEPTAERLERALRAALRVGGFGGGPVAWSWERRDRLMLSSVAHQRELLKVVLIVIMVLAACLMLATLLMMVGEKTGDIGILCAMGATPLGVTQIFLCCGLVVTITGVVLGIATGCLSACYLDDFHRFLRSSFGIDLFPAKVYNLDRVPYLLEPAWIAEVAAMALAVGALVSAGPAWRAGRHDPLRSLRGL